MSITVRLALLAVIVVAFPTIARGADKSPFDDTVFGNWGGLRSRLYDDGINLGIDYKSETASNVRGGTKVGVRYTDQWTFGTTFDLQKLLGEPGTIPDLDHRAERAQGLTMNTLQWPDR